MAIFIIFIIIIIAIIIIINQSSNKKEIQQNIPNIVESNNQEKIPKIDLSVFQNNYDLYRDDYSYLTPAQAIAELRSSKAAGIFLETKEYFGLIDAIASGKNEKFLKKIEAYTPEETLKWFKNNIYNEIKMSSTVWKAVGEKVAPMHEDYLLEKLDKVTIGRVEGWVRARKNEHYFFTQKVYDKAIDIRTGVIDNRKKRIRKKNNFISPSSTNKN